ncbi:MAG: HEPN domain-containing protein [Bacteroidota bacterium]
MPYTDRFISADNLIAHFTTIVPSIVDPVIQSSYAGFLSVTAVTVFELSIKDIFNEFAIKKNKVFGKFVQKHFERINGQIGISSLRGKHIPLFGDKYLKKFDKILNPKDAAHIALHHTSIKTSYENLITCRHKFVHGGTPTLSITEVISGYNLGKEVVHTLNDAMKR